MDIWQRAVEDVSAAFEQRVASGEITRDRASLVRYVDEEWRPKFSQIAEAVAPKTDDDLIHDIAERLGI
jgi:hypothetical protein